MGWGEARGFNFYGVAKVNLSPLIFVGSGGVTRVFGILRLGIRAFIAPGVNLSEEEML